MHSAETLGNFASCSPSALLTACFSDYSGC